MKKIKIILAVLSSLLILLSFNSYESQLNKKLIGKWEFVKLTDKNGIKVDTIFHGKEIELASGPLLNYKQDGTYTKIFNSKNTDNGTWNYNRKSKSIIQKLIYKKPYGFAAKYLIQNGHAKKDKNGEYYEIITDKVIELTNTKLVILARQERQRIYRKLK